MKSHRHISFLGSLSLLVSFSGEIRAQFYCPWGDVSLGTVESERIRQQGISEQSRLITKCNALMPREEREKLCRALGECSSATEQVAQNVVGDTQPQKALLEESVLDHETNIFAGFSFSRADEDNDLRISPKEALAHNPAGCLGLFAEFATSDRNANGLLDRDEAYSLQHKSCLTRPPRGRLADSLYRAAAVARRRNLFEKADTDQDRCLGLEEARTSLRLAADLVDLAARFEQADRSADGCLNRAEWASLITARVRPASSP